MIKRTIISVLVVTTCVSLFSQTKDVNITLSPYGEYIWWNKNTTLDNSMFVGARAGFSFGPLFEIRGFYQRSSNIKSDLRPLDWKESANWSNMMTQSNTDVERYGGEMKLNLMSSGFFAPYITVGGGIQNMKYKTATTDFPMIMNDVLDEKLFGTVGIGTKFNLSNRVVLSLEAKNTFFSVNEESYFINPDFNISEEGSKRLGNWSAMASLDFYLGGTKSYNDDIHKAYEKMFSDGFSGMKFVIEPSLAYIKLDDSSLFEEQYFLGASAGFDFSSLVGIRGFYYQATESPNKVALKFNDKLSMYGANIIARLNQPRGVNPYLILGGGYINTGSDYINAMGEQGNQSRGFAMGGVGLEIPLSKYIAIYGNVNAMLSSEGNKNLAEIETTSNVKTSLMYQTGLRFNLGKSANAGYAQYPVSAAEKEHNNNQVNELRITPDDLKTIVREAVRETREEYVSPNNDNEVEKKIDAEKEKETEKETETVQQAPEQIPQTRSVDDTAPTTIEVASSNNISNLDKQFEDLNRAIDAQSAVIAELKNYTAQLQLETSKTRENIAKANKKPSTPFMKLNRFSPIAAMDFGSQFFWNLGARGHWRVKHTNFEFVPEVYLAFGKKTKAGVSANVIYNFGRETSIFNPYVGIGYGSFAGKKSIWGTNVILGTSYKTGLGTVFMDYSVRNTFKQNQIAVGYRLSF